MIDLVLVFCVFIILFLLTFYLYDTTTNNFFKVKHDSIILESLFDRIAEKSLKNGYPDYELKNYIKNHIYNQSYEKISEFLKYHQFELNENEDWIYKGDLQYFELSNSLKFEEYINNKRN